MGFLFQFSSLHLDRISASSTPSFPPESFCSRPPSMLVQCEGCTEGCSRRTRESSAVLACEFPSSLTLGRFGGIPNTSASVRVEHAVRRRRRRKTMTKRLQWCLRITVVVALVLTCALSGKPVLGAVNLPTIDAEFLARAGSSPSPQDVIVRMQGLPLIGRVQDAGAEGWLDTVTTYASEAAISQEQNVFLLSLAAQGVRYTIKQRLSVTFNGLALSVAGYDLAAVAGTNHVSFVYESQQAQVLDDDTNAAMGVDQALWNRTSAGGQKLDGTGTTIGIIDTGIDYMHPDLGGAKFPNAKVVGGYDFADKDSDPIDIQGHGTHVAGIAAADGKVQGVAPKAKLYAYKVFRDKGGGAADGDIIAALDRSVRDRCTVVNLSLGTSGGPPIRPRTRLSTTRSRRVSWSWQRRATPARATLRRTGLWVRRRQHSTPSR